MEKHKAFFSYTRVDDEFFGGAISALRKLLELGVQVVTGDRNFKIFQDIEGIGFGQNWQNVLDSKIGEANFLIPVLTPSFLRSEACRDELAKFIDREAKIGRNDLILPVYFVTTPLLERPDLLQNDNLAIELSRRQRYDWRSQADIPIGDPALKRAVRELAEKIALAIERTPLTHSAPDLSALNSPEFTVASEHAFREIQEITRDPEERFILWVDDRPENNLRERELLKRYGVETVLALSTDQALDLVHQRRVNEGRGFDAIISDMGRPPDRMAGYTLLKQIRAQGNTTPYFIYAGSRAPQHMEEARQRGAQGTTNIPDELIEMVLKAIRLQPR